MSVVCHLLFFASEDLRICDSSAVGTKRVGGTQISTDRYVNPIRTRGGHCTVWIGVCSNGFYVDISNHHQMQQYKSCLMSFLLKKIVSFEVP